MIFHNNYLTLQNLECSAGQASILNNYFKL